MSSSPTRVLLAVAALLAAVDLWVHRPAPTSATSARLPAIEAADRVRITSGDDLLELERTGDQWRIVAPIDAGADKAAVQALLAPFQQARDLGPATDEGRLKDYTLEGHEAVHVVVHDADGDEVDLWIGETTAGGRSWVRLNGSEQVHRAEVGGKARWKQRAGALRDRSLLHFAIEDVTQIQVRRGALASTAQRRADGWRLREQPELPLDPLVMAQLNEALAAWSGQRVLEPDDPAASAPSVLTVTVTAGEAQQVDVLRTGAGWFARRNDQTTLSIDPAFLQAVADPALMWRDRRLTTLKTDDVVALEVSSGSGGARWDLTDQGWTQTAPTSRPAPDGLGTAVATLTELRVVGWLTTDDRPELSTTVRLTARDGTSQQFGVATPLPNGSVPARSSITGQQTGTIDPRVAATIRSLLTFIE